MRYDDEDLGAVGECRASASAKQVRRRKQSSEFARPHPLTLAHSLLSCTSSTGCGRDHPCYYLGVVHDHWQPLGLSLDPLRGAASPQLPSPTLTPQAMNSLHQALASHYLPHIHTYSLPVSSHRESQRENTRPVGSD